MSSRAKTGTHDGAPAGGRAPQSEAAGRRQPPAPHPSAVAARLSPHLLTPAHVLQLQRTAGNAAVGRILRGRARARQPAPEAEREGLRRESPARSAESAGGLPAGLRAGIESLSGFSLDGVRVHMHSPEPARVQAHAYTQGDTIHVGPGGEQHLAHEAWHVVQQRQGRVRPTARAGGVPINDEAELEREADRMGERALHSQAGQGSSPPETKQIRGREPGAAGAAQSVSRPVPATPTRQRSSAQGHPAVVQRALRIGAPGNYTWYTDPEEVWDVAMQKAGANANSIENLAVMANDGLTHGYPSWDEALAQTEYMPVPERRPRVAHAVPEVEVAAEPEIPERIRRSPAYLSLRARAEGSDLSVLFRWAKEEIEQLLTTVQPSAEDKESWKLLYRQLLKFDADLKEGALAEPGPAVEHVLKIERELTRAHLGMFKLGPDRNPLMADAPDTGKEKYGYHLTKLHNLPGIKARGLDPTAGASARGSVAMSTGDQRIGSVKTSTGVVAFAFRPSTFRPYINQFEDRRQMIEGAPAPLKPVMLRFLIEAIGRKHIIYGRDFMDASALNTDRPIPPAVIEVLTPEGWVPLTGYAFPTPLVELRSGDDNARAGGVWAGRKIILTWKEMQEAMPGGAFAELVTRHAANAGEAVAFIESQRDRDVAEHKGLVYTFRGATMQTSGNPTTWEYAFTVRSKSPGTPLPEWLERAHVRYMKEYGVLAEQQIKEYDAATE